MATTTIRGYGYLRRRAKLIAEPRNRHPAIGLARKKRHLLLETKFIGITGSSDKTTTEDLIYEFLQDGRTVICSDLNNLGLLVTRAKVGSHRDTEFVVQEVGASDKHNINSSLQLLQTEVVAAKKSKLTKYVPAAGHAQLNADDKCLQDFRQLTPTGIFTTGFHEHSKLRALKVFSVWSQRASLTLQYPG